MQESKTIEWLLQEDEDQMSDAYEQAAIEDEVEVNAHAITALAPCLAGFSGLMQAVMRCRPAAPPCSLAPAA